MTYIFHLGFLLSVIIGTVLTYPYSGQQNEEEIFYDQQPEYIQFVPLRRITRSTPHIPLPIRGRKKFVVIPEGIQIHGDQRFDLVPAPTNKEPITAETGYGHSSHPHDYVDYGAYTGGYGAFGWYSDHPVQTYGNSYH